MSQPNRIKKVFVLLAILIVPSVFYLIVSSGKNNYEHLPILGPREPDPSGKTDTLYHSVPEFELTNQDGATYQSKTSEGQIVVAEFFFATCQTICPKMTMQMKTLEVEVVRVKITLACTECKQRNYNMTKEKKNHPERMETQKYCKFCRKHTLHKETK